MATRGEKTLKLSVLINIPSDDEDLPIPYRPKLSRVPEEQEPVKRRYSISEAPESPDVLYTERFCNFPSEKRAKETQNQNKKRKVGKPWFCEICHRSLHFTIDCKYYKRTLQFLQDC